MRLVLRMSAFLLNNSHPRKQLSPSLNWGSGDATPVLIEAPRRRQTSGSLRAVEFCGTRAQARDQLAAEIDRVLERIEAADQERVDA